MTKLKRKEHFVWQDLKVALRDILEAVRQARPVEARQVEAVETALKRCALDASAAESIRSFLHDPAWAAYWGEHKQPSDREKQHAKQAAQTVARIWKDEDEYRGSRIALLEARFPGNNLVARLTQLANQAVRVLDATSFLSSLRPSLRLQDPELHRSIGKLIEILVDTCKSAGSIGMPLLTALRVSQTSVGRNSFADDLELVQFRYEQSQAPSSVVMLVFLCLIQGETADAYALWEKLRQSSTDDLDELAACLGLVSDFFREFWLEHVNWCDLPKESLAAIRESADASALVDQMFRFFLDRAYSIPRKSKALLAALAIALACDRYLLDGRFGVLQFLEARDLVNVSGIALALDQELYSLHAGVDGLDVLFSCWNELFEQTREWPLSRLGRTATTMSLLMLAFALEVNGLVRTYPDVKSILRHARVLLRLPRDRKVVIDFGQELYRQRQAARRLLKLDRRGVKDLKAFYDTCVQYRSRPLRPSQLVGIGFPERIQECEDETKKLFGRTWDNLNEHTRKHLIRGVQSYRDEKSMPGETCEFSTAILSFANAIWIELKRTLLRQLNATDTGKKLLSQHPIKDWGGFTHLLGHLKDGAEIRQLLKKATHQVDVDKLVDLGSDLDRYRLARNKAAHADQIDREEAALLHDLLFNKCLLRKTLEALHDGKS